MAPKQGGRAGLASAADVELVSYRVQLAPAGKRGRLLRVQSNGMPVARGQYGAQPCWQFLQGRTAPCEGCPVFGDAQVERRWVTLDGPDSCYQAVQAAMGTSSAELRLLRLSAQVLSLLCRDKPQRIAQAARLSQQELRVLQLMVEGFQSKEIASQLRISARTVKFHGTNLLRKLGAESRIGLLKLVLSAEPSATTPRSFSR